MPASALGSPVFRLIFEYLIWPLTVCVCVTQLATKSQLDSKSESESETDQCEGQSSSLDSLGHN